MNQADKFSLGGGGLCLYAPRFPRWQRTPGFFDEVSVLNAEVRPLFALSILEHDLPLRLDCTGVRVDRGRAVLHYSGPRGLKVVETRLVSSDERFVSNLEIATDGKNDRELVVVQWTWTDPEGEAPSLEGDSFRVRRSLPQGDLTPVPFEILWSSPDSKGARCLQGFFAEGDGDRPDYEATPWFDIGELPTPRAKRPLEKPSPILAKAKVYLGLFRRIAVKPGAGATHRFEANVLFRSKALTYRPRRPDPRDESAWQAFMEKAPRFICEDKRLEKLVRHRFELLHLLRVPAGAGTLTAPNVCEGNGPFHQPIAFSAPAILREARWLTDPSLARGVIRSFFDNIRQSGMVPGRLYLTALSGSDFYHADWGGGFEALDAVHPDRATKRAVLMAMQRYVKWLGNNRDPEGSGMTDIANQFEAGQELSRRYTIIDDKADRAEGFAEQFRLKGIDASLFRYRLVKFLAHVADELQEKAMANRFIAETEVIQDAIRKRMWDDKAGMYMDVDPAHRRRTGVKAAVGFYPLGTDIPKPAQVERMLEALGDRKEFWSKHPVPSLAMSDPAFNPNGQWKGTRLGCPWNGRVWPMINSHILEGLAYVAERGNKKGQKLCGELFARTVTMLSGELEGLDEPRTFEHYHPITGRPSRYRGVDHYLHSFVLDNVFRIACGFAVRFGEIQDDPVIAEMPDFKLVDLPLGNKRFTVERKGSKLRIAPQ